MALLAYFDPSLLGMFGYLLQVMFCNTLLTCCLLEISMYVHKSLFYRYATNFLQPFKLNNNLLYKFLMATSCFLWPVHTLLQLKSSNTCTGNYIFLKNLQIPTITRPLHSNPLFLQCTWKPFKIKPRSINQHFYPFHTRTFKTPPFLIGSCKMPTKRKSFFFTYCSPRPSYFSYFFWHKKWPKLPPHLH